MSKAKSETEFLPTSISLKTPLLHHNKVDNLVIENGGKLIFKDYGADTQTRLTLRAKSIEIKDGGEMWIGSRTCRYQGLADVVLYGNRSDMDNHDMVGRKYLWTGSGGTLEMHGKDKKSWTKLNEHLFKDSVAVEKLSWYQTRWQDTYMGNRFVVHVLR